MPSSKDEKVFHDTGAMYKVYYTAFTHEGKYAGRREKYFKDIKEAAAFAKEKGEEKILMTVPARKEIWVYEILEMLDE